MSKGNIILNLALLKSLTFKLYWGHKISLILRIILDYYYSFYGQGAGCEESLREV